MSHILIVEDDLDIQDLLRNFLQEVGYEITIASDGMEAIALFSSAHFDLILLDIMLPKIDGFTVCELIRKQSQVPIIMLTALNGEEEQIRGLDLQVDDYITKPYQAPVLLAHIRAVLRRTGKSGTMQEAELECRGVRLSLKDASVTFQGKRQELTKTELKLLHYLFSRQGEIVSREEIIDVLWDQHVFLDDNGLSVNITRIRNKLKALGAGPVIETKRGLGYLL